MTIRDVFHWTGVGVLVVYAIASAVRPKFVAQTLEHGLSSGRGTSEFRILHGGFYLVTISKPKNSCKELRFLAEKSMPKSVLR